MESLQLIQEQIKQLEGYIIRLEEIEEKCLQISQKYEVLQKECEGLSDKHKKLSIAYEELVVDYDQSQRENIILRKIQEEKKEAIWMKKCWWCQLKNQ